MLSIQLNASMVTPTLPGNAASFGLGANGAATALRISVAITAAAFIVSLFVAVAEGETL